MLRVSVFILTLCLTVTGLAADVVEPDPNIQDWVKNCETGGGFEGRCYVSQTLRLKSSGQKLFEIAAGFPLSGEMPLLLVSGPLGMYLPSGISMQVDNTGQFQVVVAYCNEHGCHAYYRLTPAQFRMFKQGRWLNISYLDGTRRRHRFGVSLNGFTDAIASVRGQ